MARPLVSVLCVTHDRPEWMDWLGRQWARQTIDDFELIVVDSTVDYKQRKENWRALDARLGDRVRFLDAPANAVPKKYDEALFHAKGHFITLSGDDDWQSPTRLERALPALQTVGRAEWAGFLNSGAFVNLLKDQVSEHDAPLVPASTLLVRADTGKAATFAGEQVAGDTRWSNGFLYGTPGMVYPPGELHSLWMRHAKNITAHTGAPRAAHSGYDLGLEVFLEHSPRVTGWDEDDEADYLRLRALTFELMGLNPADYPRISGGLDTSAEMD